VELLVAEETGFTGSIRWDPKAGRDIAVKQHRGLGMNDIHREISARTPFAATLWRPVNKVYLKNFVISLPLLATLSSLKEDSQS